MIRSLRFSKAARLWNVGVAMAILVAAVVSIGVFIRSVDAAATLANGWDLSGFYAQGQNPWAHSLVPGEEAPVRTAAQQPHAKLPALR